MVIFYHGTDSINMKEILKRGGLCIPEAVGEMCDRNDPACDSQAIYVTTDFQAATSFARIATRDENDASIVFEIQETDVPEGARIEPDDYIGGREKNAYRIKGVVCIAPSRFTVIRKESSDPETHAWRRFSKLSQAKKHDGKPFIPLSGPRFRRPFKDAKVRVREHLKHPPRSCLCHKSKAVNRARRSLVRRLK